MLASWLATSRTIVWWRVHPERSCATWWRHQHFLRAVRRLKRCLTSNHGHGSVCRHDLESVKMSRCILLKEVSKHFGFHPC